MMQNFGIYVHIPFCQKKCRYCDFTSFDKFDNEIKETYVQAILREIENCEVKKKVTTIYIGGGTPSILPAEWIQQILQKICEKFEIQKGAEITIEVNPGMIDFKKLKKYRELGINRLSIGLQAVQNSLLKLLGRIHTFEDFERAYEEARKVGFTNVNVDLMLGLPTQMLAQIKESLQKVMALKPEHISLYSLILEKGTELEELVSKDELQMITEDLEREMYWQAKKILEENGYSHYEISNFATKGFVSRHNLSCWEQEEYIGFGVSAHSYVDKKRFCNGDDLLDYIKSGNVNRIVQEEQTFEEQAKEYVMLGLRKIEGISISQFERKFRVHPLFYFRFEISKLEKEGLLEVDLDAIRLTKKGLDFANLVFEEFV